MSGAEVVVDVGREGRGSISAATTAIERTGPFSVVVTNHDTPIHVHCRLSGQLEAVATVDSSNQYVEPGGQILIPVNTPETAALSNLEGPIRGQLEVITEYGAATVTIDVTLAPPTEPTVDESLAKPTRPEPKPGVIEMVRNALPARIDAGTVAVGLLGLLAIGVAVGTAAVIEGPAAMVGAGIVVIGVLVAFALLFG